MYSFVLVVGPSSPFGNRLDCWLAKNCWLGHASHSAIVWIAGWATLPTRQSCALLVGPPCPFGNRVDCWLGCPAHSAIAWIAGWAPHPIRQWYALLAGPPQPIRQYTCFASLHKKPFYSRIKSYADPHQQPLLLVHPQPD